MHYHEGVQSKSLFLRILLQSGSCLSPSSSFCSSHFFPVHFLSVGGRTEHVGSGLGSGIVRPHLHRKSRQGAGSGTGLRGSHQHGEGFKVPSFSGKERLMWVRRIRIFSSKTGLVLG